ncbi:MAG: EamA family transporter, partial [Thermoplasmatota archaeon]
MDKTPLLYIIISASLFGLSAPLAKILVSDIEPIVLAGLLYLGAFLGLSLLTVVKNLLGKKEEKALALERGDIPWLAGAIVTGGVLGPITLMMGLKLISGFVTSLLLNLEGLATGLIAVLFFKEEPGKRIWLALGAMTVAGV